MKQDNKDGLWILSLKISAFLHKDMQITFLK